MHEVLELEECELSGHALHSVFPVSILYVPSKHGVHVPPSGPLDPALHVHVVFDSLATGGYEFGGHRKHSPGAYTDIEYLPAPQYEHSADPRLSLNFPATHGSQSPVIPDQPVLLGGHGMQ